MPKKKNTIVRRSGSVLGRLAVCIDNQDYPASLDVAKLYRVLPDLSARREGFIRVIDESGEDYLYPKTCFKVIRFSPPTRRTLNQVITRSLKIAG